MLWSLRGTWLVVQIPECVHGGCSRGSGSCACGSCAWLGIFVDGMPSSSASPIRQVCFSVCVFLSVSVCLSVDIEICQ